MVHFSTRKAARRKRGTRPETRLVLPSRTNTNGGGDVLKSLIDTWLVPRLVDLFVQERAGKFSDTIDRSAAKDRSRAA